MTSRSRSLPRRPELDLPTVRASMRGAARGVAVLIGACVALGCSSDGGSSEAPPPPAGGQTGEESFGCQPVERDPLAWSERSTLGFSADELLNSVGSESDARLAWSSGGTTPLTLGIERAAGASVEFQARDYVSSGAESAAEVGAQCNDVVAIPITLSFATTDGAFAEQWPMTLLAESPTRVTAFAQIDVADLQGTFRVTQVDPSRFDRVLAIVELTFTGDEWRGTLSGQGIMGSASGPNGSSSATPFAIGSF